MGLPCIWGRGPVPWYVPLQIEVQQGGGFYKGPSDLQQASHLWQQLKSRWQKWRAVIAWEREGDYLKIRINKVKNKKRNGEKKEIRKRK